jgi:hypothetical protein
MVFPRLFPHRSFGGGDTDVFCPGQPALIHDVNGQSRATGFVRYHHDSPFGVFRQTSLNVSTHTPHIDLFSVQIYLPVSGNPDQDVAFFFELCCRCGGTLNVNAGFFYKTGRHHEKDQ